ncbi:MAG: carbon-nitrogen hydrolase family protein [Gammaproteobacteria bacterium]
MSRLAAIQMASGPNVSANLTEVGRLISQAVDAGAELVVLPENFAFMGMKEQDKLGVSEAEGSGPIQDFIAAQADKHRVWIVAGTLPLKSQDPQRVAAACLLYNERGEPVARYDKVHLFDVKIQESRETYNESQTTAAGTRVTVVETPFGRLGLAICYDLRFPELFRRMATEGVDIIAIPSAFTAITGKAHWEVLLRARAIENLAYVVASAQGGYHVNGRETFGHSMIIDPWGRVLDCLPSGSGVVVARLDQKQLEITRRNFPVLQHRKLPCDLPSA